MTFAQAVPAAVRPPNYAVGLLLSIFLPGAGLTYLGRWGWHLGWAGLMVVLNMLGLVAGAALGAGFLLLPILGWIAQLVQYHFTFRQVVRSPSSAAFPDAGKVALIVGHVVLGALVALPLLAAVLIPNLLSARQKAMQVAEQSAARNLYTQVMVDQVDGRLSATCPQVTLPDWVEVAGCAVDTSDPETPVLNVTFGSGRRVRLP